MHETLIPLIGALLLLAPVASAEEIRTGHSADIEAGPVDEEVGYYAVADDSGNAVVYEETNDCEGLQTEASYGCGDADEQVLPPDDGDPGLPEVPPEELPEPGTPGIPDPGVPGLPDPGAPGLPDPGAPEIPDPGAPDLPPEAVPQPTPEVPTPGTPEIPDPGPPEVPDPGAPEVPAPGLPSLP